MRIGSALVLVFLAVAAPALAAEDTVYLKNGDKLTGELSKFEGGTLTLKTTYAKEVKISQGEVAAIDTQIPARVVLTSGDVVLGRFVRRGDETYLQTDKGSARAVQLGEIESIGVPEVAWANMIGLSLLGTTGNTKSSALGAKAEFIRTTKANTLTIGGRGDYQEKDNSTTVQSAFGRIRYDHQLTDEWFVGGFDEIEHDFFKNIRVRNRVGVGPGYRFIHTPTMLLSTFAGIAYTYVNYRNQPDDSFPTAVANEQFRWDITDSQLLYQTLDIYPSLQHGTDWTLRGEIGFRQAIAAGLFLDLAFVEDYDHEPAPGRQTNDLRYTVSIGYAW